MPELDPDDFLPDLTAAYGGVGFNDAEMMKLRIRAARSKQQFLTKAITVGNGAVQPTDTGGRAARTEFIHGALSNEAWEDEDAATFEAIPKIDVSNTAIQWGAQRDLGYDGDGFLPESGDGNFNGLSSSDADYRREIENVKFVHDVRQVGLVAEESDTIEGANYMDNAARAATSVIKARSNIALLHGDALTNAYSSNGIKAQIIAGVRRQASQFGNYADEACLIDMGGNALDSGAVETFCRIGRDQYSKPTRLIMDNRTYQDLMISIFPQQRDSQPGQSRAMGDVKWEFQNPYSKRVLKYFLDTMLRPNQPLVPQGTGGDGKPRTLATASKKCLTWAATPFTTVPTAVAAGAGSYYNNVTTNDMQSALTTVPATPYNPTTNSSNRLAAGTYYYAVSAVYLGRETAAWVNGAASPGIIDGNIAGTVVSAGQVVKVLINLSASIAGLGTTIPYNAIRFRVYRAPVGVVPATLNDFDFLQEVGCPINDTKTYLYDNGMYIPGTSSAFVVQDDDKDGKTFFYAQQLPLMKRELPNTLMSDIFGYILFGTPILKKRGRHLFIRNIGRTISANLTQF